MLHTFGSGITTSKYVSNVNLLLVVARKSKITREKYTAIEV